MKLRTTLVVLLAAFSVAAQAKNVTLIDQDTSDAASFSYNGTKLGSSFDDTLTFTLGGTSEWFANGNASGKFFGLKLDKLIWGQGLTSLNVEIFGNTYSGKLANPTILFGAVDVEIPGQTVAAGTYTAHIWGKTVDTFLIPGKPSYSFSLTALPVLSPAPEPESYAMLLAGLGFMGAMARRRRNNG